MPRFTIPVTTILFLVGSLLLQYKTVNENYIESIGDINYGTGFFINRYQILTNHHVVINCTQIKITEPQSKRNIAKLVAQDTRLDLAVVQVDKQNNSFALLHNHSQQKPKEFSYTIGYPAGKYHFNVGQLLHTSYVDRDNIKKTLISNTINQGNSGGALLSNYATVIGVIDAYYLDRQKNKTGSAIHLDKVKAFLANKKIRYYVNSTKSSNLTYQAQDIEKYAQGFTVKIRCINTE